MRVPCSPTQPSHFAREPELFGLRLSTDAGWAHLHAGHLMDRTEVPKHKIAAWVGLVIE
jgi:hypothetical protein